MLGTSRLKRSVLPVLTSPLFWLASFLILVLVIVSLAIRDPSVGEWLQNWDTLISAFVSGLFTILLLFLYKSQRDLLESDYKPTIRFEGYRIDNKSTVWFLLSNVGGSAAVNLRLNTTIENIEGFDPVPISTFSGRSNLIRELDQEENEWIRTGRNYLYAQENYKRFFGGFNINTHHKNVEELNADQKPQGGIRRRFEALRSGNRSRRTILWLRKVLNTSTVVRVTSNLLWDDTNGNTYSDKIVDDVIVLDDRESLNHIFSTGDQYDHFVRYIVDNNNGDVDSIKDELSNKITSHRIDAATEDTLKRTDSEQTE